MRERAQEVATSLAQLCVASIVAVSLVEPCANSVILVKDSLCHFHKLGIGTSAKDLQVLE